RGLVLPARRAWPEGHRLVLHAPRVRALLGPGDARATGCREESNERSGAARDPRVEGARSRDGLGALPRGGVPIPRRGAPRGVPHVRREGEGGRGQGRTREGGGTGGVACGGGEVAAARDRFAG